MAPKNLVHIVCLPYDGTSNLTAHNSSNSTNSGGGGGGGSTNSSSGNIDPARVICCPSIPGSSGDTTGIGHGSSESQEFQAVLYIVITLLFYSIGIIVGIVTYLKQEKEEIEENKMYEEFIALNRSQANLLQHRSDKVQLVIDHLKRLEEAKLDRSLSSARHSVDSSGGQKRRNSRDKHHRHHQQEQQQNHQLEHLYDQQPLLRNIMSDTSVEPPKDSNNTAEGLGLEEYLEEDPFQNRRLSQVVAKIFQSDTNIVNIDDPHCQGDEEENQQGGPGSYFQEEYQCLVEYNQEPKNKELFREAKQQQDGWRPNSGKVLNFDESVSHVEETDTLMNVDSSKPQDYYEEDEACEGRFIEEITEEEEEEKEDTERGMVKEQHDTPEGLNEGSNPDTSVYQWSVTSV